MPPSPWLLGLIGVLTGIMGGMLGIGGGVILIPLLVWVVRVDQRQAQGTSLGLAVIVVVANLWNYWSQGYLYWDLAAIVYSAVMGFAGMAAASYSSGWALKLPTGKLTRLFSFIMLYAAGVMIWTGWHQVVGIQLPPDRPDLALNVKTAWEFLATGLAGGFASGVAGIGGNVVMVPIITELLDVDQKYAQGLAVGAMLPIVYAGARKYMASGAGNLQMVLWLAPGSLLGVYLGGELLRRISSPELKLVFGAFLAFTALWQLITGGPKPTETAPPNGADYIDADSSVVVMAPSAD